MALRKSLNLAHVFCIASGAMISSGIFVLPGLAHAAAGPAVVVSYLLAGLLATTGLLSIAELATAMPKAGGDYFFVARGMGPALGTVAGLLTWFSLTLKSAFALVGMAAFAQWIAPFAVNARLVGIVLCMAFVAINLAGAKETARLQVVLVGGLMVLMLVYVVRGLPAVQVRYFEPFAPLGWRAVFATVGLVFVSYGGLLNVASVAEEVRRPGHTIPLGMVLSLLVVTVFYTLMVFVTSGVLSAAELDKSLTPISDGAGVFLGRGGRVALGIGAVLAFVSTANAGVLSASRYLLALSRDRLLPRLVGRVSAGRGVPYMAVLATGALAAGALFLKLNILVEAASTVLILSYMLANLSVIVLRESRLQNYRPQFRAPLYPWVQILGVIGLAFVILEMGEEAFGISALLVLVGFCVYWFYGRSRAERESALLHLIERLLARELVTGTLELELKGIIRERDEMVHDRFDRAVEQAPVLELGAGTTAATCFEQAADALAPKLGQGAQALAKALSDREAASSTVVAPGLAIPHVVVGGEGRFQLLLARSQSGIRLDPHKPPVHAIFILAGSRDERNFHLRSLAAIAQIAQAPSFLDEWRAARNTQALRDLVLLSERQRFHEDSAHHW